MTSQPVDAARDPAPAGSGDLTPAQKERGMHFVLYGAALGIVYFLAVDSNVFTLFVKRLGASNVQIGMLISLLQVTAVMQVFVAGLIERHGKKRFIIGGWLTATALTLAYPVIPWVAARYGGHVAIYALMCAVVPISLARQVGTPGWMPLLNDVVPGDARGRFFAKMRTIWQAVSIAFLVFASLFFAGQEDAPFWRYQVVFLVGIAASFLRVAAVARIPEMPVDDGEERASLVSMLRLPFADRAYVRYIVFTLLVTMALAVSDSFAVVYLKSRWVAWDDSHALFVSTALAYVGSVMSLLAWGALADRVGAKPLLVIATLGMGLVRFLWFGTGVAGVEHVLIPSIFLLNGVFFAGFGIANTKYLFGISPRSTGKTTYIVTAGVVATLVTSAMVPLGGWIIDGLEHFHAELAAWGLDEYRLPFVASGAMVLIASAVLVRLKERGTVPTREVLAALVSRPVRTSYNAFLFGRALGEDRRVGVTRALGDARSVLGEDELMRGLNDPSFQVRLAAARGLGRLGSRRAVPALMQKTGNPRSFIRVPAAEALGEIGAPEAVPSLSAALSDRNVELRFHAALALGRIGSPEGMAPLREAIAAETDGSVWAIMATSLAMLGDGSVLPAIVARYDGRQGDALREQLMVAASSAIGSENTLYQYLHAAEAGFAASAREIVARVSASLAARGLGESARDAWERLALDEAIATGEYRGTVRAAWRLANDLFSGDASLRESAPATALGILAAKPAPLHWEAALLALVCLQQLACGPARRP